VVRASVRKVMMSASMCRCRLEVDASASVASVGERMGMEMSRLRQEIGRGARASKTKRAVANQSVISSSFRQDTFGSWGSSS